MGGGSIIECRFSTGYIALLHDKRIVGSSFLRSYVGHRKEVSG
jgi:hypothetical protein